MKIEVSRGDMLILLIMTPINMLTLGSSNDPVLEGLAFFSMVCIWFTAIIPMFIRWRAEDQKVLSTGDRVEWEDTEGVLREGVLLGKYNNNWLVDWSESSMAVGSHLETDLRKVKK